MLLDELGYSTQHALSETPHRMWKALVELTSGRFTDLGPLLETTFEASIDEMITVRGIPFVSLCEHHVMPFTGTVTIGYVPNDEGEVIGLSKLPRLVRAISRRLQMQETMTQQIAERLMDAINARGVAVLTTATHTCMSCRGIESAGETVTTSLLGCLREAAPRAEFLSMAGV